VFSQTISAGRTARAYQESMSQHCQTASAGRYAARHGPWPYWLDARERQLCRADDVPAGTPTGGALSHDIRTGNLPVTGELTPDLCNDGHDCPLSTADRWLGRWVPALRAGPDWRGGRLTIVITFDEDDYSAANRVAFVVLDPRLSHVVVRRACNHYCLTRWLDENAGVRLLRNAAFAADLRAAFHL
jgi:acid phosphatase